MLFRTRTQEPPVLIPTYEKPFRPYTPDAPTIGQYQWQNVFLYGEDMRNRWRNEMLTVTELDGKLIRKSEYCGPAYTLMKFSMWVKQLGGFSFPIVLGHNFPNTYPPNPLTHIKGEVWKVRPTRLYALDILRQNGLQFKRVRVSLDIPYRRTVWTKRQGTLPPMHMSLRIRAWMYIGVPDYWDEELTNDLYKPARVISPKNPRVPEHYIFENR